MSDARRPKSLFDQVCLCLDTGRRQDETAEEFKIRAAKAFNGWSQEEYDELPETIKMWLDGATRVLASNLNKTRPRALPGLPGLDATLQRFDINKPLPRKGAARKRVRGEDAVTRVMTVLAEMDHPEEAKTEEVRDLVNERFQIAYSDSAIKQATNSFIIAREVLGHASRRRAQHAAE